MRIDVLTAVPELFASPLQASILKRAQRKGLVTIGIHNLHDWGRKGRIDDYPYGGGAGMAIRVDVVVAAMRDLSARHGPYEEVIYLTADGEKLTQKHLNTFSLKSRLLLIAGHYKGIDDRIRAYVTREISIGDYVLTGGELPALVLIDGVVRLIPGVLSDIESALEDSFQDNLLSAPVYTRPAVFEGQGVPPVLLSGDHQAIARWRWEQRLKRTAERRPDFLSEGGGAVSPPPEPAEASEAPSHTALPPSPPEAPSKAAHDTPAE
jgi:tRNA (guanine37-N1)-methyltransferase